MEERDKSMSQVFGLAYSPSKEVSMERKTVELPTVEEVRDWLIQKFGHVNKDTRDYLFLGADALYTHLGGESLIKVVMPGEKKE